MTSEQPPVVSEPLDSRDIFDDAIDYLIEHPTMLYRAYRQGDDGLQSLDDGITHPSHVLFMSMCPGGRSEGEIRSGCLSQVKAGTFWAYTVELTRKIQLDPRIDPDPVALLEDLNDLVSAKRPDLARALLLPYAEHQREARKLFAQDPLEAEWVSELRAQGYVV
jgi:hypothetical protein